MKIRINNQDYSIITIQGMVKYMKSARRNVIQIDTDINYDNFVQIGIKDNIKWSILQEEIDADGKEILKEYDNSSYNLLGDIIIHCDGKVSFFMCESTKAELLQTVINDLLEV